MMDPTPKNPLHSSLDVDAQPLEAFIETVATGGTGSLLRCSWISRSALGKNMGNPYLDEPRPLPEPMQSKLVGDLCSIHGIGKILLVGKDKEEGIPELILVQHPLQLFTSLRNTFPIIRVDDEDDTLGVLEIWNRRAGR